MLPRVTITVLLIFSVSVSADRWNYRDHGEAVQHANEIKTVLAKPDSQGFDAYFSEWKQSFGKSYTRPGEELGSRHAFRNNLKYIADTNIAQNSFTLGPNEFSDLTPAQFQAKYLMSSSFWINGSSQAFDLKKPTSRKLLQTIPTGSIDHSAYLTPVKNQGACGSCVSFATAGVVEAAILKAKNLSASTTKIDLSEQQMVDCTRQYNGYGCSGASLNTGLMYMQSNAVTGESKYLYRAATGSCDKKAGTKLPVTKIASYTSNPANSFTALYNALLKQPVLIGVNGNPFQSYKSGVLTYAVTCATGCGALNHAVVLVGYGYDAALGKYYWKIRNSWGAGWGESGYVRLEATAAGGPCAMFAAASYNPVINTGTTNSPFPV